MNIKDFEKHIEQKILSRGLDYFKQNCITSLENDGNDWTAEVEGSEDYDYKIKILVKNLRQKQSQNLRKC